MSKRQTRILQLVEHIDELVNHRRSPEEVAQGIKGFMAEPDLVDEALEAWYDRVERIHSLRDSTTLTGRTREDWYRGPRPDDVFWPALKEYLEEKKFGEDVVASIDDESTTVVSCLDPPWASDISTRGLVVGHVQSGKTANFTAVTAKSADAGYRIFIVLSGMTNSLRRQTQRRLERELIDLNEDRWHRLTRDESDFERPSIKAASLLASDHQKILAVTKKNASRLRKLIDWLGEAANDVLRSAPALIIDDEADYASVNTQEGESSRSTINALILELMETLPRAAYVGYTATPFANVFINPEAPKDLYPRSFIHALPTPEEYFGPEAIFGRDRLEYDDGEPVDDGFEMVRFVPEAELSSLTAKASEEDREDFQPTVTAGLHGALRYFLLATAARRVREQEGFYSTMLVHTDFLTVVQNRLGARLQEVVESLRGRLKYPSDNLRAELRRQWENETSRVPSSQFGIEPVGFDALAPHLSGTAEDLQVVVANSTSPDSLDYEADSGTYMVVGGNVLSRGLTLEGLLVSFFVRRAGNYDTLLQMGRWFGYWEDYADLPRLWMTEELYGFFYDLATVEREVRNDIGRYTELGVTPTEFAVRVRTHPELNITSPGKMGSVVEVPSSYSGREIQTTWFRHRDAGWLENNLEAARDLIGMVQSNGHSFDLEENRYRWIARGADVETVRTFLDSFSFHDNQEEFRLDSLLDYLDRQLQHHMLERWNVAIIGQSRENLGSVDLGLPEETPLVSRSRMKGAGTEDRDAYVKALMSRQDLVADFEELPEGVSNLKWKELRSLRYNSPSYGERGLLLLYPIARDSRPSSGSSNRVPLNAVRDVVGVGLVFPDTDDFKANTYIQVQLDLEPEAAA